MAVPDLFDLRTISSFAPAVLTISRKAALWNMISSLLCQLLLSEFDQWEALMADWKDGEKGAHGWVSSSLCPGQPQPPLDRSFLDSSHTALSLSLQPSGGDAPPPRVDEHDWLLNHSLFSFLAILDIYNKLLTLNPVSPRDFPGSPVVKTVLPMQGYGFSPLVRGLRSPGRLCGMAKT